jgi:predicted RNA-binding Zn ribbon-like protein
VTSLALELARTVRSDGRSGVTDLLATPSGYAEWLSTQFREDYGNTDRAAVIALRRAIRALFAHAVDEPAHPTDLTMDAKTAQHHVNTAAKAVPRAPQLDWPRTLRYENAEADDTKRLLALLARATIELLTGDDRKRLRACPAPRCVHYFVQAHPRQAWCRPACGNRTRVRRYYHRHQDDSSTGNDSTP